MAILPSLPPLCCSQTYPNYKSVSPISHSRQGVHPGCLGHFFYLSLWFITGLQILWFNARVFTWITTWSGWFIVQVITWVNTLWVSRIGLVSYLFHHFVHGFNLSSSVDLLLGSVLGSWFCAWFTKWFIMIVSSCLDLPLDSSLGSPT